MLTSALVTFGCMLPVPPSFLRKWESAPADYPRSTSRVVETAIVVNNISRSPITYIPRFSASQHHREEAPLQALSSEVTRYSELSENWDGAGATCPSARVIALAQELLRYLPAGIPVPRPMLSSGGDIGFFWDSPVGFADVEIDADGSISLFTKSKQGGEEAFADGIDISPSLRTDLRDKLAVLLPR